jgi:hypothetical protein
MTPTDSRADTTSLRQVRDSARAARLRQGRRRAARRDRVREPRAGVQRELHHAVEGRGAGRQGASLPSGSAAFDVVFARG